MADQITKEECIVTLEKFQKEAERIAQKYDEEGGEVFQIALQEGMALAYKNALRYVRDIED